MIKPVLHVKRESNTEPLKMYCLVVIDDFSRFTWVFFLATKDKTSGILKSFITRIENLMDYKVKVKVIRCDNGTEFKNREMNQFCEMKGILRQFSVAKTPQQNGVAERRNRILIQAARTMLADSKLLTTFWAETVNTACYEQNKCSRLDWLFDIDALTRTINYELIVADFVVYQMDVKSVFSYGKIKEEVYVCQPPRFEDLDFPDRVTRLNKHCMDYIKLLELEVKNASIPMETQKPLLKDEDGEEVDVHMYRSMIGSLMYLTSSRPDIMFGVARYGALTLRNCHLSLTDSFFLTLVAVQSSQQWILFSSGSGNFLHWQWELLQPVGTL
nr:putative ribonuclease H-like domain-containing protein [Tanacetum cinerariifolium]